MASSATIWEGPSDSIPAVNADGNIYEETHIAVAGQTVYNLLTFTYTPDTKTIFVVRDGFMLRRAVDFSETDNDTVTMSIAATGGERVTFIAYAIAQVNPPMTLDGLPMGGSTGQVLTKLTGSDFDASWQTPGAATSLLDAARQNVASAPTVDLTAIDDVTRNIQITGNTQIDGFSVTNGQVWAVKFAAPLTLSNNVNIVTGTGASVLVPENTTCLIRAIADNVVEVLGLSIPQTGMIVNRAYAEYATWAALNTQIPVDDTIPQVTEGTEILSVTITPKRATNRLRVRFQGEYNVGTAGSATFAAFTNASADAIAAAFYTPSNADVASLAVLEKEFVPGVTTAVTISIRVGPSGAFAVRLNGSVAARRFGGKSVATLVVEEIAV